MKDELVLSFDCLVFEFALFFFKLSVPVLISCARFHPSSFRLHPCFLRSLIKRIASFAVEIVEVFDLDEVEVCIGHAL
jgi:hypothetical protein